MGISKVVYGLSVLMDLTSDTVDSAHLAKGYTAHDSGGNLIIGSLEQHGSGNFLSGVTPSLLNGTTQNGKAYVIPSGGAYGENYIEYPLDIPAPKPNETYSLILYGKTQSGYRSLSAELYFNGGVSSSSSSFIFTVTQSAKCASFDLTSEVKPTKLVVKSSSSGGGSVNILNATLMILDF